MRCAICKRESDEVILFEGILDREMILICDNCSESEGIPIIKKPSSEQLEMAKENYSVRERMERISGMKEDKPDRNPFQTSVQKNLARLRVPERKQQHEDLVEDYYWKITMARRRKKITTNQLANELDIDFATIEGVEKGKLPKDINHVFAKLESYLGVRLLKIRPERFKSKPNPQDERRILEEVKMKMKSPQNDGSSEELIATKKDQLERLSKGETDFSKRENLDKITLSDLVDMKRKRERREAESKRKVQTESMLGDDIELDDDF